MVDLITGTIQENKANKTAEALSRLVANKTKVVRNDDVVEIVVESSKHDSNLAVKIMKTAQDEFESKMYISVSFKE